MAMAGKLATSANCSPFRPRGNPQTTGSLSPGKARLEALLDPLLAHLVVALVALVGIGGATRVMQAGLACPDWPLCFGSLLPGRQMNLQVFLEWFHRLDAFLVGVALLVLATIALVWGRPWWPWLPWAAGLALALVVVQGGLGALTVVGLLAAASVTAHLLTALLLVAVVSATHQALRAGAAQAPARPSAPVPPGLASSQRSPAAGLPSWWWVLLTAASLATLLQCGLGAAMASRWAVSLCLTAGEGCQWLLRHRLGAWPAATSLLALALASLALPPSARATRFLAWGPLVLVAMQVPLGVLVLRLQLQEPLITVAHQILAALLVAVLGALWGRSLAPLAAAEPLSSHRSPLELVHG
jgi:cytochrome c oxidase assembly protein subunit 15